MWEDFWLLGLLWVFLAPLVVSGVVPLWSGLIATVIAGAAIRIVWLIRRPPK